MFKTLYIRVLKWSAHPRAPYYLTGLSVAEASIFPIPPDVMLAPMCLAKPERGWFFAAICTAGSVSGGVLGYLIGSLAFEAIGPWLQQSSYADVFQQAIDAFARHGFWYILLAGFTPIPYKIFTISAGVVGMPPLPFLLGSVAGRGGRFFLVAALIRLGGERLEHSLRKWIDVLGWSVLGIALILFAVFKLKGGVS